MKTQPHQKQQRRSSSTSTLRKVASTTKINHNSPILIARQLSPQGETGHDTAAYTHINKLHVHKGRQREICPNISQKHEITPHPLIMPTTQHDNNTHKTKTPSDKNGVVNALDTLRSQYKEARLYRYHHHFYTHQLPALPTSQDHTTPLPSFYYSTLSQFPLPHKK